MTRYDYLIVGYVPQDDTPPLMRTVRASNPDTANFIVEMFRSNGLQNVRWQESPQTLPEPADG